MVVSEGRGGCDGHLNNGERGQCGGAPFTKERILGREKSYERTVLGASDDISGSRILDDLCIWVKSLNITG